MRNLVVVFSVALFAGRGIGAQDPSSAKKGAPSAKQSASSKQKNARKKTTASKTGSAPAHVASAKPATKSTTKSAATSQTAHRRVPSKTTKRTPAVVATRHSTQQQPTPERYREIQQALADKGYFKGSVDGQWGAESVDALKRFQREQNITDDGKIGSLSLIALGLGPHRSPAPEATPEKAQPR